ncbi:unnamed protein product, partial [Rotaria sordida]
MGTFEQIYG